MPRKLIQVSNLQEAEERKAQQEAEQAAAAEAEADAADPVKRLRKAAASEPADEVVALLAELAGEGGTAVRMRLLYQVSPVCLAEQACCMVWACDGCSTGRQTAAAAAMQIGR